MGCGCGSTRKRKILKKKSNSSSSGSKKPVNSIQKKGSKRSSRMVKIKAINRTLTKNKS